MIKQSIANMSLAELLALREQLWRAPPSVKVLEYLRRVDKRIEELQSVREP